MSDLQILDLVQRISLELFKLCLPILIELLEMFVTNGHILLHLGSLNVSSQFILVFDDVSLHHSNLLHQILVDLVFVDLDALLREQLHLLFDNGEDEDLFILIKNAITTLVEDLNELCWSVES